MTLPLTRRIVNLSTNRILRDPDCEYCRQIVEEDGGMGPYHDASPNCESGSRTHCTCDTCF
jgi:hypothetical protein